MRSSIFLKMDAILNEITQRANGEIVETFKSGGGVIHIGHRYLRVRYHDGIAFVHRYGDSGRWYLIDKKPLVRLDKMSDFKVTKEFIRRITRGIGDEDSGQSGRESGGKNNKTDGKRNEESVKDSGC